MPRHREPLVQLGEHRRTVLGGNHPADPPVRRILVTFDQPGRFEIVQEVGHHGSVDTEVSGQCELATDIRSGGGRQYLVAPWSSGKFGHGGVGRGHVGPEDHAQTPPEVISERCVAPEARRHVARLVANPVHSSSIRSRLGTKMIAFTYHL